MLVLTKTLFSRLLLFIILISQAHAQEFSIFYKGHSILKTDTDGIEKIIPSEIIEIVEPHVHQSKQYKAFSFKKLMNKLKAQGWEKSNSIKAACLDGYKPTIKIKTFMDGDPYLAFATNDGSPFEILKSGKAISVAPYYLVWKQKMKRPELMQHLNGGNWPYQLISLSFE